MSERRYGPEAQTAIYMGGLQGVRPPVPTRYDRLEEAARAVMAPEAFAYVAGGAGMERSMAANRAAFDAWRIAPHMLGGAGVRDLSVDLFGRKTPHPLMTAPIGVLELCHPEADVGLARAAAGVGAPMIVSSQASRPMEEIADALAGAPWWFQLYWGRSDELAKSFVQRAERAGATAIVITLDTTILGWRPQDLDLAFLPFLHAKGIAQYTSDPVFRAMLSEPPEQNPLAAAVMFTQVFSDPALDWARVRQIKGWTSLPVLLKGIVRADDAAKAIQEGFDGVIVSNHGGRQVDGAVGALDALQEVTNGVDGRAPVLFDSGVRTGADAFKALALGATAVCVGRPYAYGLALAGEAGCAAVLRNLVAELDLTMALSGCETVKQIGPRLLRRT